jgi:hypothetical protein
MSLRMKPVRRSFEVLVAHDHKGPGPQVGAAGVGVMTFPRLEKRFLGQVVGRRPTSRQRSRERPHFRDQSDEVGLKLRVWVRAAHHANDPSQERCSEARLVQNGVV